MYQPYPHPQHPAPLPPRGRGRLFALILGGLGLLIVGLVVAIVVVLTGGTAPSAGSGQPRTEEAARKAAQETFDTYSAGEYGNSWDLWAATAQQAVSRADYEKINEQCPPPVKGVPFTITKVDLAADGNSAQVRTTRTVPVLGTSMATYDFVYESGAWRWMPDAGTLAAYTPTRVKQQLAGNCA